MSRPLFLLLVASLLAGCAIRTSDAQGRVTTIGFVWSTQPAPGPAAAEPGHPRLVFGAEHPSGPPRWIQYRAAGLILENTPRDVGLTLGYKNSLWIYPDPNAVTVIDGSLGADDPPRITVQPSR